MQTAVSVGNGGEAWIGYKQDLRPCQYGLMMSIEPSFSVFYEGLSVVDYTQAVLTKNPMRPWEWMNDFLTPPEQKEISKELKGVVVRDSCCVWRLCRDVPVPEKTRNDAGNDAGVAGHVHGCCSRGCGVELIELLSCAPESCMVVGSVAVGA